MNAYKTAGQPLPHAALVKEMSWNSDFARFVIDILPSVSRQSPSGMHRALITFHTGAALNFIARSKSLDEGTMAYLLPASLEPLRRRADDKAEIKLALLKESIVSFVLFFDLDSSLTYILARQLSDPRRTLPKM